MNCDYYRKRQVLTEEEENLPADVRQHFNECEECQTYSREQERLRTEVRKLAKSEQAPQGLRESVADLLRQPRARKQEGARRWVGVAAAIVLLVGAGATFLWYHGTRTASPERLAQEFITDHLHYLPGREQIVSGSTEQVEGWFRGRIEFPVHVPDVPGAVLEDARVCDISGRKAALLHYRRNPGDALISVFVAEEPKAFEHRKMPVILQTSTQGVNSTLWCHRGLVYDVVAALDDSSLQQIAESVRKQSP
jgi:anti-sigma factor RsiW